MSKKRIAIFTCLIGFLFLIMLLLFKGENPSYNLSPVVAKNVARPYSHNGEVYFYTGHGFAKYNVAEQKTATLSEFMSFPKILDVSISDKNAVYKTNEVFPTDSFYSYLKNRGLPPDRFYWWLTDFVTGKTSLIAEGEGFANEIVSVKQAGDGLLVARQVDDHADEKKFELYKYKGGDGNLELIDTRLDETFIEIVWANEQKAIYSSKKNGQSEIRLNLIDFTSKNIDGLPADVGGGSVTASPDGSLLAFQVSSLGDIAGEESLETGLYYYRLGDKKPKLVLKGFVGNISSGADNNFVISGYMETVRVTAILDTGGKLSQFDIKDKAPKILFLSFLGLDFNQLAAVDGSKNLYILSKDKTRFKETPSVPNAAYDISQPEYNIHYFDFSDSFSILIIKNPYKKNVGLALKDLQALGVDTNQHGIIAGPVRTLNATP